MCERLIDARFRLLYSRYNKTELEMNALEQKIAQPMAVNKIGTDAEAAYGYGDGEPSER